MVKINQQLFPIKAHYFFFFSAMGPLLPFFPLIGKQLGMTKLALGVISSIFPILYLFFKPAFGYIADYFHNLRKVFFIGLLVITCLAFDSLYFTQHPVNHSCESFGICSENITNVEFCQLTCGEHTFLLLKQEEIICRNSTDSCHFIDCDLDCPSFKFYHTPKFWIYVLLVSLGNIFFNITNFISDAICLDVLGKGNDKKYGIQRVWGTIGFGITALMTGLLLNHFSTDDSQNSYAPAFVLASACMFFDIYFSLKLQLPPLMKSESIVKDVYVVMKQPKIVMFLVFAVFVGIMDSSVIYFLLLYLEDLAVVYSEETMNMKLLQGLTIAAETLLGETIALFLTEKMLVFFGYAHCMTMGFFFYFLRLGLIACINDPWMILPIEAVMQGPTYALLYTTIVAYAGAITPPGTSATVQGLVAGMDDGLGYSLGSLISGVVYHYYGGRVLYISFSMTALICCLTHFFFHRLFFTKSDLELQGASAAYIETKKDTELQNIRT